MLANGIPAGATASHQAASDAATLVNRLPAQRDAAGLWLALQQGLEQRGLQQGKVIYVRSPGAESDQVLAQLREHFAKTASPQGWEPKITEEERLAWRRYEARQARQRAKIVALADAVGLSPSPCSAGQ